MSHLYHVCSAYSEIRSQNSFQPNFANRNSAKIAQFAQKQSYLTIADVGSHTDSSVLTGRQADRRTVRYRLTLPGAPFKPRSILAAENGAPRSVREGVSGLTLDQAGARPPAALEDRVAGGDRRAAP